MSYTLRIKTDQPPELVLTDLYNLFEDGYTIEYSEDNLSFVANGPMVSFGRHRVVQRFGIQTTVTVSMPYGIPHDNVRFYNTIMQWFNLHDQDAYTMVDDYLWMMQINGELRIDYAYQQGIDYSALTKSFEFAKLP